MRGTGIVLDVSWLTTAMKNENVFNPFRRKHLILFSIMEITKWRMAVKIINDVNVSICAQWTGCLRVVVTDDGQWRMRARCPDELSLRTSFFFAIIIVPVSESGSMAIKTWRTFWRRRNGRSYVRYRFWTRISATTGLLQRVRKTNAFVYKHYTRGGHEITTP